MKNFSKIKYLSLLFAMLVPLAAIAADGPADGKRLSAEQRQARIVECKADPVKCRAERQARYTQWCNTNPERCKEMQARMEKRIAECKANPTQCKETHARMEKRMAECKANPEKCRAERQARFEQRFKLADADGNGMISRVEAEKAMPRLVRRFDRIDADKDGQISKEEIAVARKVHFEQRRRHQPSPTEAPKI